MGLRQSHEHWRTALLGGHGGDGKSPASQASHTSRSGHGARLSVIVRFTVRAALSMSFVARSVFVGDTGDHGGSIRTEHSPK
jgi:hypothetical protein